MPALASLLRLAVVVVGGATTAGAGALFAVIAGGNVVFAATFMVPGRRYWPMTTWRLRK